MGLKTGWITLIDPGADIGESPSFILAAHHNFPPALALDQHHSQMISQSWFYDAFPPEETGTTLAFPHANKE